MVRDWTFWSVLWLVVNVLIWLTALVGGGWAVRAILRQVRPKPPEETSDPHEG